MGGWNKGRGGGLEHFSKINKREGQLFGTREYMTRTITWRQEPMTILRVLTKNIKLS